ncbi:MAG TPA: hypothetical protein DCR54_02595 [Chloroflexi bacterium]|jgi:hypothetical protein|nr:hypothetical protein [Chloroflexota bacterium]
MKREDLVSQTRRLIEEGDRIDRSPSRAALNTWLAASDALLSEAWGSMDRYHLAWLEVGRIAQPLRGREISTDEESQEIRSVVSAKGAVMRASLDAVERLGMPFLGETRPRAKDEKTGLPDHLHEAPHGLVGGASALQSAIDAARKEAAAHEDHALNRKSTPQKSDRTDLW